MKSITLNIDDKVYDDMVEVIMVRRLTGQHECDMLWSLCNRIRKAIDEEHLSVLNVEYAKEKNKK